MTLGTLQKYVLSDKGCSKKKQERENNLKSKKDYCSVDLIEERNASLDLRGIFNIKSKKLNFRKKDLSYSWAFTRTKRQINPQSRLKEQKERIKQLFVQRK